MKVLELFAGTCSFSKVARELGHEVITLDNDNYHDVDIVKSILDFNPKEDLPKGWKPDIIWASPPCTTFSVMSNFNYWEKINDIPVPKNSKASINLAFVLKTLEIIKELKPRFWIIENPRGLLRKFPFMERLKKDTVTYCQYGTDYMKPTDLWNNINSWNPRPMCKNGMPCHQEARRGAKTGIQGDMKGGLRSSSRWSKANRVARSIVPRELCLEMLECIGRETKEDQIAEMP